MNNPKQPKSSRTAAILLVVLFALAAYFAYTAFTRNIWSIPPEAKLVKNPLTVDPAVAAKQILPVYLDKCSECHGETGQGNGPQAKMYDPRPRMLTDAPHLSTITDGDIRRKLLFGGLHGRIGSRPGLGDGRGFSLLYLFV